MKKPLRVLMVEDSEDDALLLIRALQKGGYDPEHERVETAEAMRAALREKAWDVILCDYRLPQFNGLTAIGLLKESGIDIPLIIVSGAIGEETAVECMRLGAHDYVMKGNLSRLVPATERELKEAESRVQRKRTEEELAAAHRLLSSLLDAVPDLLIVVDKDYRIQYTNFKGHDLINQPDVEKQKTCYGRFKLLDAPCEDCSVLPVFETGHSVEREMINPADGRYREVRAFPIFNLKGQVEAVVEYVRDITERKQTEEQLRESLEQVRRAMQTTIQVLVMAVEIKDPYTAGHQRRMTNLARTMATEMGLPPEKIEGLRMAGVIHDIGKITLPTEILSKPTKLSGIELSLIREHVRLGYDILKDVESPWPLAEIVLQHHERMDGSGYPRGLKGEEILIESSILAVADVVEAMASHRPYRAALGIDAALAEIEKNKGTLYDPATVEICLRLFREKGFQLEGA